MLRNYLYKIVLVLIWFLQSLSLYSQTPGMIYEPATGAGTSILDPNGDGYTSATTSGFTTDDQLQSEIPYVSFVIPQAEPNSDIDNAPDCGYTDFVENSDKDAAQKYLSPSGKWLFRLRMGGTSPNAKSYSILIDTDGLCGNTGATADPDYTIYNPGFEIEIVLATKSGVFVYNVNTPNCTPVISYPGTTNYQKSVALSTVCGDPDYFLDFFVTFSDLTTVFGVTQSTPMRYAIISNTGSNVSTVCSPSSASDVVGTGSITNLGTVLTTIVDGQGPCPPNEPTCLLTSTCPVITTTLISGNTSVNGTSTEANGTTINLYKNGVLIGSTTVSAGTWTISGLTAFVTGDIITATATAPGEYVSSTACNTLTVSGPICTAAISYVNVCSSNKSFQGIATPGATIKLYNSSNVLQTPTGGTTWNAGSSTITATTIPSGLTPNTENFLWKCNTSGSSTNCNSGIACLPDGNYYVTAQSAGECESPPYWFCVGLSGTTATPTITTTITTATTSVSGTIPAPDNAVAVTVYLYKNNIQIGSISTSNGSWTINGLTFSACDSVKAQAIRTAATEKCPSAFSTVQIAVTGTTAAPVIPGPFCTTTTITTVSGISSEANGTVIQVYDNGIAVGSTTTVSNGAWNVSGLSISPGHTITAKATAACKTISSASTGIMVYTQSSSASLIITTSPIVEQSSSVSGTYGTNGASVQLYLDGAPIGSPATVSGGVWSVTGLPTYALTVGGTVTATVTNTGYCASNTISGGNVVCILPNGSATVTPGDTAIVAGNCVSNIRLFNSENSVIYQLYLTDGITTTGHSVVGTGGTIILASGPLSSSTTLKIKAFKIPVATCNTFSASIPVSVGTLPIDLTSFTGKILGPYNMICWTTASESNNDYFTLEKTEDGVTFETVGIEHGAGDSYTELSYTMIDEHVKNVVNYYRLKQTDLDGENKCTDFISINNKTAYKEISSITNILGEEVNEYYRGLIVIYYSDGTIVKIIR